MDTKQKTIGAVLLFFVIITLVYALPGMRKWDSDDTPVTIGFITPFSKERGIGTRAAVELAAERINESGGIKGRPLEVIYKDGGCEASTAAAAANELIHTNKVPVILGGLCSHETLAFTDMAEQTGTVVLSYCSLASEISDAGDYIFRNIPSGTHLARFAAKYLREVREAERIAVLYTDVPYGVTIAEELAKNFIEVGGEIVLKEPHEYAEHTIDLEQQIVKIREANPDLIYFLGYSGQLAPGMRQIREAGIETPVFGGSEWDSTEVWTEPATDGVEYIVTHARINNDFKNTMQSRFGITEIIDCTPQAYDGLQILAQVIGKVGSSPEDIKDELYRTTYLSDISLSQTKFDGNGDIRNAFYIVKRIEGGASLETEYYRTNQFGDYYIQANSHQPGVAKGG